MSASSVLKFVLVGEDKSGRAWKSAASGMDLLAQRSERVGKSLSTWVTAPLAAAAAMGAKSASDQEQAFGALESVYKGNADAMKEWSAEQAKIGLSASAAGNAAVLLGAQLKNAGADTAEAAAQSQKLVGLGADLAATFGGPTSDAVVALSAAFKGEFDPIEKYGVSLRKSDINARLAAQGQDKLTGAALKAAEVAAAQAIIWEQTADAQGQAARESDSFAGSAASMTATLSNTGAVLADALLPYLVAGTDVVKSMAEAFAGMSSGGQKATLTVVGIAAATGPLVLLVSKAITTYKALAGGFTTAVRLGKVLHANTAALRFVTGAYVKTLAAQTATHVKAAAAWAVSTARVVAHKAASLAVAAASKVVTAGQWLLNAALAANPIGLVIAALVALGVGLVVLWKRSDTFRNIVTGAFKAIASGALTMAGMWLKYAKAMTDVFLSFVGAVVNGAAKALGWVPGLGPKLKTAANEFGKFRDKVGEEFDAAIGKVEEWKGKVDSIPTKSNKTVDLTVNVWERYKSSYDPRRDMYPGGPAKGGQGGGNGGLLALTHGIGRPGATFGQRGRMWSWQRDSSGMGRHNGADLSAPGGTPVYATSSGRVAWSGWGGPAGGWAGINVVQETGGARLTFAHLSRAVANGFVRAGSLLGYVGSTGNSSGNHLHVSAQRGGSYVNPIPYLADGGIVRRRPGGTLAVIGEGRYDEAVVPLKPGMQRGGDVVEVRVFLDGREIRKSQQVLGRRTGLTA